MVETLKHASISINEVIDNKSRLEANVYNVESRNAKEILANCKWDVVTLNYFSSGCFYGGRGKRNYVPKSKGTIGFIGSAEMLEINPKPAKHFSKRSMNIEPFKVSKGTVLISRSGTIGNVTLVNETLSKFLVSEHAIRFIPKEYEGYIWAYLKSDIGRTIVESKTFGAVILQIEPEHILTVDIPNPSKKVKEKIHDIAIEAFSLRDQSNTLLKQAEDLLLKALKLPAIEDIQPDFYSPQSSVMVFTSTLELLNNRFDASYHNPIANKILDYFFDAGATVLRLDNPRISQKIIQAGRFKRTYVESDYGTVFLGGKQILELDPCPKKYLSTHSHQERVDTDLFLRENMIAITRSGTIGKVQLVPKHWENWAMSEHVLRVVPADDNIAGYLFVWLNTDYGKALIKRLTYGAVIDEIEAEHLAEVPIPLLKKPELIAQINQLALQANKLRTHAYHLEKDAVNKVNEDVIFSTK